MIVPCMVNSWLYCSGDRNWRPGRPTSARISRAITPPTMKNPNVVTRYITPICLWSVVRNSRNNALPLGGTGVAVRVTTGSAAIAMRTLQDRLGHGVLGHRGGRDRRPWTVKTCPSLTAAGQDRTSSRGPPRPPAKTSIVDFWVRAPGGGYSGAMTDYLAIYLRDQLALGLVWRELAKRSARSNRGPPAGAALRTVADGISQDVDTFKRIMLRLEVRPNPVK